MLDDRAPAIVDASDLTEADWAAIFKLRGAYDKRGEKGLAAALDELANDPVQVTRVLAALLPDMVRAAILNKMVERAMTEEDLHVLIRKLRSSAGH